MTNDELFKARGEISFKIDILQAQLNQINQELVKAHNANVATPKPKESKTDDNAVRTTPENN